MVQNSDSGPIDLEQIRSCLHNLAGLGELFVTPVPKEKPLTRKQFNSSTVHWPTHFYENKRSVSHLTLCVYLVYACVCACICVHVWACVCVYVDVWMCLFTVVKPGALPQCQKSLKKTKQNNCCPPTFFMLKLLKQFLCEILSCPHTISFN